AEIDASWEADAFNSIDLSAFLRALLSKSQNVMAIQLQRFYYVNDKRIGDLVVPLIVDMHGDRIQILDFDNVRLSKDCVEIIYCRCHRLEALSFFMLESRANLNWRSPNIYQPRVISRSARLTLLRVRVEDKDDIPDVESGVDRMTAVPRKLLVRRADRPEFWRLERIWRYNPDLMQPERTFTSEWLDYHNWNTDMEDMIAVFRV
ncbi:hypothetical protein FRC17_008454, partial [Serendipita sp. 399]